MLLVDQHKIPIRSIKGEFIPVHSILCLCIVCPYRFVIMILQQIIQRVGFNFFILLLQRKGLPFQFQEHFTL